MRWTVPLVAASLLVGLAGCGIGESASSGCTTPHDEPGLLRQYAADPVFAVTPTGVRPVGAVKQVPGCHGDAMDLTQTSATEQLEPGGELTAAALHQVYDPAAAKAGWKADVAPSAGRGVFFTYCRMVSGVTSVLSVTTWPGKQGGLYLRIAAWPERSSCASPPPSSQD